MKTICREQYILTPAHVDRMSERFREVLDAQGIERKECLRLRLSLEEILLNWMEKNEGAEIRLFVEGKRGKLHITMETEGKEQDPLAAGEAYGSTAMADRILSGLGLVWSYQYTGGVNQVSIRVEGKKPGQFWYMGAAFVLALFTGSVFGYLPAQAARAVTLYGNPLRRGGADDVPLRGVGRAFYRQPGPAWQHREKGLWDIHGP